jgi:hypothetical protein
MFKRMRDRRRRKKEEERRVSEAISGPGTIEPPTMRSAKRSADHRGNIKPGGTAPP